VVLQQGQVEEEENEMIDRLFTYIYLALAIYFTTAFLFYGEDRALFIALWCGTMLEIRAHRNLNIFMGIEHKQETEGKHNDT